MDNFIRSYDRVLDPKTLQEVLKIAANTDDKQRTRGCLLYTSPSPRDVEESRMPSSA